MSRHGPYVQTDTATNPTANLPYSYAVSYDGVGNATHLTDSLMGAWSYTPPGKQDSVA